MDFCWQNTTQLKANDNDMDYSRICSENICSQCKFYNTQNQDDICTKRETKYCDFNINVGAWTRPRFFLITICWHTELNPTNWRFQFGDFPIIDFEDPPKIRQNSFTGLYSTNVWREYWQSQVFGPLRPG